MSTFDYAVVLPDAKFGEPCVFVGGQVPMWCLNGGDLPKDGRVLVEYHTLEDTTPRATFITPAMVEQLVTALERYVEMDDGCEVYDDLHKAAVAARRSARG